ncbi:MAG: HEPN domain-containing protein [Prevotellaceae bacterium]|jgi:uncharacterized protein (UPF0332 family)|nr:HEPN domain-containing protein [Prevotellaceae bacterium]
MGLTSEERTAIVRVRLGNAKKTFAEVSILMNNALWRTAANRLYYACFYAASALLINDGHQAHTHNGVISLLGMHYISKKIINEDLGDIYRKLFNLRQKGDYDDWTVVKESDLLTLIEPAEQFIKTIEELITNK